VGKLKPAILLALFGTVLLTWSVVLPVTGLLYLVGALR
jgi:hypothetical protein